jgi:phosphate transport system substrate-binding protein
VATAATIVCLTTWLAGTVTAQAASITGAGSTLMAPLMAKWIAGFQGKYGIGVTYGSVGSGAGIMAITNKTVDFGASDAPLTSAQAAACGNCVMIPWALTATGIAFHLNGVSKLKLSGPVLANIFLGRVTMWNDPSIKKLNKGVNLPALKITPAYRTDGSGDTYAFTDWLSRVSSAAKTSLGVSTKVNFTTGVGAKGNDGLTAVVTSTNGSVSYISASYIIAHHLATAALQNAAGNFVYPNLNNIKAAAQVVKNVPASNELHIVNPPKKQSNAYPLSTFSYAIVRKPSTNKSELASFIYYAITTGQGFGPALDFAPLPAKVKNADVNAVNAIKAA